MKAALRRAEEILGSVALAAMVLLPLTEIVARGVFGSGVPGSVTLVQHLTLWVTFVGAALAARDGRLLSLATGQFLPEGKIRDSAKAFASAVAAAVSAILCVAGVNLVLVERMAGTAVTAWLPAWVAQVVLPISFALIAVRLAWRAGGWVARSFAVAAVGVGLWLGSYPGLLDARPSWPGLAVVLLATVFGGPIFAALGGIAVLLFMSDGVPPAAVLAETYRLTVSPTIPAIPLFTLVGFFLAEGGSSHRLLRFFRAFFGSVPGGTAVVCALTCAFFTIPTGG
ncbi:MAG: TRAP transporter small permease subunit, partial [Acidobacteriota bacterium]|nr:TRAP transporter small permease subunit [Acidobacteriota bacterium]